MSKSGDKDQSVRRITAEEFEMQARMAEAEVRRQASWNRYKVAAEPIVRELEAVGYRVESCGELARSGRRYSAAIPVLLRWLPRVTYPALKEDIVRTLGVRWAGRAVAEALLEEFAALGDDGLRWVVGNSIEVVADDSVYDDVVGLVCNRGYGKSREMLAMALGRMKNPAVVGVLMDLLGDEQVVGHAVVGLRKLRIDASAAKARLESLAAGHPKAWIRREAAKALKKM